MNKTKRLYILRHAKSDITDGLDDKDRTLNSQGHRDSRALGKWMADRSYEPDFVYCSPALRTSQTFENIGTAWGKDIPHNRNEKLYLAGAGQLYEFIKSTNDKYESVLVVGHNPGIHELVRFLLGDANPDAAEAVSYGYAPCTLCVFDCEIENWAALAPHENRLIDSIIGGK